MATVFHLCSRNHEFFLSRVIIGPGIIFILSIYVITFYVRLDFDFACDTTNSRDRITGKELHVFFPYTKDLRARISDKLLNL